LAPAFLIMCFPAAIAAQKQSIKTSAPAKNSKPAENKNSKESVRVTTVREGVGFDGIKVGKSPLDDVVKKFGKNYKWTAHKKYSFQTSYPKLGLSFYLCQADQKKQIFDIEIRAPFQAKTSKGVVLGKSTLEDIYKVYGKSKDGLEYRGVNFFYANYKGRRTVTVIDIVENTGIRQCGTDAPEPKNK
jgi:endonuclease YncB( thermonuclease family)